MSQQNPNIEHLTKPINLEKNLSALIDKSIKLGIGINSEELSSVASSSITALEAMQSSLPMRTQLSTDQRDLQIQDARATCQVAITKRINAELAKVPHIVHLTEKYMSLFERLKIAIDLTYQINKIRTIDTRNLDRIPVQNVCTTSVTFCTRSWNNFFTDISDINSLNLASSPPDAFIRCEITPDSLTRELLYNRHINIVAPLTSSIYNDCLSSRSKESVMAHVSRIDVWKTMWFVSVNQLEEDPKTRVEKWLSRLLYNRVEDGEDVYSKAMDLLDKYVNMLKHIFYYQLPQTLVSMCDILTVYSQMKNHMARSSDSKVEPVRFQMDKDQCAITENIHYLLNTLGDNNTPNRKVCERLLEKCSNTIKIVTDHLDSSVTPAFNRVFVSEGTPAISVSQTVSNYPASTVLGYLGHWSEVLSSITSVIQEHVTDKSKIADPSADFMNIHPKISKLLTPLDVDFVSDWLNESDTSIVHFDSQLRKGLTMSGKKDSESLGYRDATIIRAMKPELDKLGRSLETLQAQVVSLHNSVSSRNGVETQDYKWIMKNCSIMLSAMLMISHDLNLIQQVYPIEA